MKEQPKFIDNTEKGRFELVAEDSIAFVDYIRDEQKVTIFYTEIPMSMAKIDDLAIYFMNRIVKTCEEQETELDIICPFARAVIDKMQVR